MSFFFDTKSALAKIEKREGTPATSATSATQATQNTSHVAKVADVAAPLGQIRKNEEGRQPVPNPSAVLQFEPASQSAPPGQTAGGRVLTWTGKVVSLDDWRNLSEWERHGSTGKIWNGQTQQWEGKT